MGELTQSGQGGRGLAARMKRAAAAPPPVKPAPAENVSSPQNPPLIPPLTESLRQTSANAYARVQFLDQIFQASPDGLSIADSNHIVLWANETFVRMFGYSQAEVIGQQLESLVVPLERQAESRWASEALAKGDQITLETQRRKKDGNLLDVGRRHRLATPALRRAVRERDKGRCRFPGCCWSPGRSWSPSWRPAGCWTRCCRRPARGRPPRRGSRARPVAGSTWSYPGAFPSPRRCGQRFTAFLITFHCSVSRSRRWWG